MASTSNVEEEIVEEIHRCFACEESLGDSGVSTVKKLGIATLLASAVKRRKREHQRFLERAREIKMHTACHINTIIIN